MHRSTGHSLHAAALLLAVLTLSASPAPAAEKAKRPVLSATDQAALKAHVGKEVAVEGTVVSTAKGTKDGMRFLNFSDSASGGFVAAVVPAVYPKLQPLESYAGRRLRVTGTLETYKQKTEIEVTRISQIKVLPAPKAARKKGRA